MVGVTKIQRGNAGYWLQAVAEGGDDYYNKPGEAPGEWVGEIAADLGLSGQVDAESYSAILEGRDPVSGEQLVTRPETRYRPRPDGTEKRVEPVLGYDVRFSAPKSISLLYALGSEDTRARIVAVLNDAVRQGIEHLEAQACMVQRGKGGVHIERGAGFIGMAFRHRMSRSGDPALHVHVVISNLTRALSDGKWLSLASPKGRSPLFPYGKSAGVVFQAALRAGIRREFGLDFEAVRNGYADLKGFSRDLIDAFSTRAREIANWLEKHGVNSVQAAQTAAYRTRANKEYGVDEDDRRAEWIERGEPHGLTQESVERMVAEARPQAPRAVTGDDLDAALARLEETSSHFDQRDLLYALADQLPEGADLPVLTAALDRLLVSDRLVCLHESSGPLDFSHYTTPRIAALEEHFIDGALGGVDAGVGQVPRALTESVLERYPHLSPDQREMVLRLTTGGEQVIPVAAWPGTGKTTALDAARAAWEAAGFDVIGCATARTASGELVDAGILDSTSIRALLMRIEGWQSKGIMGLKPETVIAVDEGTMVSTPDIEALRLAAVECGGKLVVIGDPQQIGAIGPGGSYGHLTRIMEPVTLTEIHRQKAPEDRAVVTLIHEGRGSEALDLLRTRGRLIVGDDLPTTLGGILADWHHDYATGADVVMIARRNRDVDYLNDQARALRRDEGVLGSAEVIVGERPFAAGDRVQTRINTAHVANRERWDVIAADAAARTLTLRRVGGDERAVTVNARYLDRRTPDGAPAVEYAYALTKFGAQGKTVDRAYPFFDAGADLENELVAVSRGREIANVYVVASSELVDPDLGPARRELSDELHDVRGSIEREGNDYAAAEVGLREQIKALPTTELAERRAKLAAEGRAADPALSRRDRLERAINEREPWVARLRAEREALEAMKTPPQKELRRVTVAEQRCAERLSRDLAERDALPPIKETPADAKPRDPATRLEAALIDQRIAVLTRREVRAARLEPSEMIYRTLGPFPTGDGAKAYEWGNAAHSIYSYRLRHGINDDHNPLGAHQPRDAAARAERARAQRRIEQAQRRLAHSAERGAERPHAPSIGIG